MASIETTMVEDPKARCIGDIIGEEHTAGADNNPGELEASGWRLSKASPTVSILFDNSIGKQ